MPQNTSTTPKNEDSLPQGALSQPLAEYFLTHGITAPPIELTFAFSMHETAEDVNWVEDLYRETDIFIPEMANWTPEGFDRWVKVASGDESASLIVETYIRNIQNNPHHLMKGNAIAKMNLVARYPGKRLCVIDVAANSEFSKELRVAYAALHRSPAGGEYFLQVHRKRDTHMLLNLSPALGNLIRRYPELGIKEKLKVLLTLGSDHNPICGPLLERGEDVKQFHKAYK